MRSPKRRKEVEWSTQSKSKHEASRNTKQVNDQSQSKRMAKASGKMRQKQAKSTKTSQNTSEVKDLRNPEVKAAERRVGQQRSPKVYPSS